MVLKQKYTINTSAMDQMLRCNNLKCRKELRDRALVTTCSHIFCTDCAARLGLTSQRNEHRNSCPACSTPLVNPDDAVISNLNPSEDYKTSVLSGLSPYIIIECASRALSFWAYQATQQVFYHEKLATTLTEKYSDLSIHLDKVIDDANLELSRLHGKLADMETEQDNLRKKNEELGQAYKEKNRKLLQVQELYDKLKQRAMLGQMQDAAEDAVDSAIYGASMERSQFNGGSQNPADYQERQTPYTQHHQAAHDQQRVPSGYQQPSARQNYSHAWPVAMGSQPKVPVTPSTHRQRLGEPTSIGLSNIPGLVVGTPRAHQTNMNMRPPQNEIRSNSIQGGTRFPAVGLSSGLKIGHDGGDPDGLSGALPRPRAVAQRPTPLSSTFHSGQMGGIESIRGSVRSGFTNL